MQGLLSVESCAHRKIMQITSGERIPSSRTPKQRNLDELILRLSQCITRTQNPISVFTFLTELRTCDRPSFSLDGTAGEASEEMELFENVELNIATDGEGALNHCSNAEVHTAPGPSGVYTNHVFESDETPEATETSENVELNVATDEDEDLYLCSNAEVHTAPGPSGVYTSRIFQFEETSEGMETSESVELNDATKEGRALHHYSDAAVHSAPGTSEMYGNRVFEFDETSEGMETTESVELNDATEEVGALFHYCDAAVHTSPGTSEMYENRVFESATEPQELSKAPSYETEKGVYMASRRISNETFSAFSRKYDHETTLNDLGIPTPPSDMENIIVISDEDDAISEGIEASLEFRRYAISPADGDTIEQKTTQMVTTSKMICDAEKCLICLEEYGAVGLFVRQILKCAHIFCDTCLVQWLGNSATCPECRIKIRLVDDTIYISLW